MQMKKFLLRLMTFFIVMLVLMAIGLVLPPTPRAQTSLLMGEKYKMDILKNTSKPRVIFIGGSNLSFGLDSKMIQDSLGMNPVNMAIHASIGLKYMMDKILPQISAGDVVVVCAEYEQFNDGYAYGREELLRTIFDVKTNSLNEISIKQWYHVSPFIPKYALSKFVISEYLKSKNDEAHYLESAFNQYGDVTSHWNLKAATVQAFPNHLGSIDLDVIGLLSEFNAEAISRGGRVILTFPGLQATSFRNNSQNIDTYFSVLETSGFTLAGNPTRYIIPDSLIFDTPYHLTRVGTAIRTNLLIHDLRPLLLE